MKPEVENIFADTKGITRHKLSSIGVSVTPEDRTSIVSTAKKFNVSVSEYIRRLHYFAIRPAAGVDKHNGGSP